MAKIIAFVNQKGGVGKTTSAINISFELSKLNKKTLLFDLDPQGHATIGLGFFKKNLKNSAYDLFTEKIEFENVVKKISNKLSLVPATINLAGAEIILQENKNGIYILKNLFNKISKNYDYIIIDCPPSTGILIKNALICADKIVVPIQAEFYSLDGIVQLLSLVKLIQKEYNQKLELLGIFFTMFDARTVLSRQILNKVKEKFKDKLFDTIIPRNVRISEAQSFGKPISEYDKRCISALSYQRLAKEILLRNEK